MVVTIVATAAITWRQLGFGKAIDWNSEHTDLTVDVATSLESNDFHDFWGWGRRYALRLLSNEFDSEDVVQEAFVRLVTKCQRGEWNPP